MKTGNYGGAEILELHIIMLLITKEKNRYLYGVNVLGNVRKKSQTIVCIYLI